MTDNPKALRLLDRLVHLSRKAGADMADAVLFETTDVRISTRKLIPEGIERAESSAVGLRVWSGSKQAIVSSTDSDEATLAELAERAVAMARSATEDTDSVLADPALLVRDIPELELFDPEEPKETWLTEQCRAAEEAALAVKGVTNSEGADAVYSSSSITLVTSPASSSGAAQSYRTSHLSLSVSVLAGEGTQMERDYDFYTARRRADLPSAQTLGESAGQRAVKRLNPRRMPTCEVPVVFEPRVGKSLLSYFAGAINGAAVARQTSFLKDSMEKPIFSGNVTIIDDPHIMRGLGSKPFDAEGVRNAKRALVEGGVLQSWLLDVRSARKLGLTTTGHAARGVASPPSPSSTNLYMRAGRETPQALIKRIKNGFYVTETFGMGVNLVTGDYSQGASGFWIENGEITHAVSELTIAGKLQDMFASLVPANDLEMRYSTNVPTLLVERMTVAGS